MSIVKSFSVNNGDMFYIKHGSDNFTIIDCHLDNDNRDRILKELGEQWKDKEIIRVIITHPDEDHILGLKDLNKKNSILNFYCTENNATKEEETESFKFYCEMRDGDKAYFLEKDCSRKYMNKSGKDKDGNVIGSSGINILWPDVNNKDYKDALKISADGGNANNICPIIKYSLEDGVKILWFGDLETDFFDKIEDEVDWESADIIFAPHHGRSSGRIPSSILGKIDPKIIIVGEADSKDLEYYKGYNTITQNSAGDITLDCEEDKVHIYCSNKDYSVNFLDNLNKKSFNYYIGSLSTGE